MIDPSWPTHVADALRRSGIRLFATVPDYIVTQVLEHLLVDPECTVVTTCREEEGLGLLSGAYLAGRRGARLMQNSGLGNCVNTLASLNVASQIPVVLVISHRGDLVGIEKVLEPKDEDELRRAYDRILSEDGPFVMNVKVEKGRAEGQLDRDVIGYKLRFMKALSALPRPTAAR